MAVLLAGAGLMAAHGIAQTTVAKLAETGEVSCEPALPVFCGNIHVSCSGPSALKAFPFKLRASGSRGWIETAADTADPKGIGELYENGRLDWDSRLAYVIVQPHRGNGYVKVQADGSYSFRHYSQDGATMSRGYCR